MGIHIQQGAVIDRFALVVGKQRVVTKAATGYVYFFKYKVKGQEGWMMAISGIQPEDLKKVNTDTYLTQFTRLPLNGSGGELEAKLDELLERVSSDDAARQEFVDLLETMGADDPRTGEYRRALSARLF